MCARGSAEDAGDQRRPAGLVLASRPRRVFTARGRYIDFLIGMKVKLWQGLVLSGGVNVPVTDDGFRAAVDTGALEYYF